MQNSLEKFEPEHEALVLPYLTADLPGIGGRIKVCCEDFFVDEIPLYQAAGEGTHTYFRIEKKGLATCDVSARIANMLGVRHTDVGYAGRKDTKAVTRQWMSVEHIDPERLKKVSLPNIQIIEFTRHSNKLKTGHLSGNRFAVRIREMDVPAEEARQIAEESLKILCRRGVPNYFGPQRFGARNDAALLGEYLLKNKLGEFADLLLGRPDLDGYKNQTKARKFYEAGDYEQALYAWPGRFRDQKRVLKAMLDGTDKTKAAGRIGKPMRSLLVSAWQSQLFNETVTARMPEIDKVLEGDMAWKHDNGACFRVEDAAAEQPRCDAFEISPTGPLYGIRMTELTGAAGAIENAVLEKVKLDESDMRRLKLYGAKGGRRALRFRPRNIEIATGKDERREFLELRFELDSGCYATTLLRELMKNDVSDPSGS